MKRRNDTTDALLDAVLEIAIAEGFRAAKLARIYAMTGISPGTQLRWFGSKEAMDCAALRLHGARWREWFFTEIEERAVSPRERLNVFFAILAEWIRAEDYAGCLFQRALAEYPGMNSPVRQVVEEHRTAIFDLLRDRICMEAGKDKCEDLAHAVMLMMEGALAMGTIEPASINWAHEAARRLAGRID